MSAGTPILLERDNVNDEFVILSRWFVKDGEWVDEGVLIAEVETSKANVEVMAPRTGYLQWGVVEKADIAYETPIGHIYDEPREVGVARAVERTAQAAKPVAITSPVAPSPAASASLAGFAPNPEAQQMFFPASTEYTKRFSQRAKELIAQHGLSEEKFTGLAMVRASDVLDLLDGGLTNGSAKPVETTTRLSVRKEIAARSTATPKLPATEIPLSRMKRSEAQALEAGTRNAIPSAVTVTCLTRGLRAALQRNPIVAGNVGAVVIYETARLLRKYPAFNATYRPDTMMQYEQVNVGYAIDDGRGLKVAVLQDCDIKSLAEIAEELQTLVVAYLDNKLSPAQISGATFTVSDLSGMGVASFLPLISEDQGAILGVGGEQFLPGSRDGCYTLTLTFDHQLSEGRTAALFLNDLKERLMSYEQAMSNNTTQELTCARCGRTSAELPDAKSFMVQSIVPPGYLCNLCVAGL